MILQKLFRISYVDVFVADDTKIYSIIKDVCNAVEIQRNFSKVPYTTYLLLNLNLAYIHIVMHIGKTIHTNCTIETSTSALLNYTLKFNIK